MDAPQWWVVEEEIWVDAAGWVEGQVVRRAMGMEGVHQGTAAGWAGVMEPLESHSLCSPFL